jgi:hypothetical protein
MRRDAKDAEAVRCYETVPRPGGRYGFLCGVYEQLGEKTSGLMKRPELHDIAIGAVAADFDASDGDFNLPGVFKRKRSCLVAKQC